MMLPRATFALALTRPRFIAGGCPEKGLLMALHARARRCPPSSPDETKTSSLLSDLQGANVVISNGAHGPFCLHGGRFTS